MAATYLVIPSDRLLWDPWRLGKQKKQHLDHPSRTYRLTHLKKSLQDLRRQLNAVEWEMRKIKKPTKEEPAQPADGGKGSTSTKVVYHFLVGPDVEANNIKLTVKDHHMQIDVKKEGKSTDGSCRWHKEFMNRFTLPKHVEMTDVRSVLTSDGYLRVEVTVPKDQRETLKGEVITPEGYLRIATPTRDEDVNGTGQEGQEVPVQVASSGEEEKPSGCLQH